MTIIDKAKDLAAKAAAKASETVGDSDLMAKAGNALVDGVDVVKDVAKKASEKIAEGAKEVSAKASEKLGDNPRERFVETATELASKASSAIAHGVSVATDAAKRAVGKDED